ncbi:hypothetical protein [Burkholderia sp. NLJ2]|uniref:hypothetical protein n=1 Tax=Burkholderia sp. NLJ2 TaxID=3090699 RepID=UPI003C6C0459
MTLIAGNACRSSGARAAASAANAPEVAIAQPSRVVQPRAARARQAPVFRRDTAWCRSPRAGLFLDFVTSYRSSCGVVAGRAARTAGRRRKRQMIQYINSFRQGFVSLRRPSLPRRTCSGKPNRTHSVSPCCRLRTANDGEHTIYNHASARTTFVCDWFVERLARAGSV